MPSPKSIQRSGAVPSSGRVMVKRLNRRPGLPIRVKLRAVSHHDHVRSFEAIAQNMGRITDLDIYTQHEDWVLHHGSHVLAGPAPILAKLCIAVESVSRSRGIVAPPRSLFAGSAPHLTSVSLKDTTFLFGELESVCLPSVVHASVMYTGVYEAASHSADGNGIDDSETDWRIPFDLLDRVVSIFPHLQSLRLSLWPQWSRADPGAPCRHYPATRPSNGTRDALARIQCLDVAWCAAAWPVLRHFDLESMPIIRLRVGNGGVDIAATCALPVPHCALIGLASASVKGASEDEGIVELASLDGRRLTRIVTAPVEECWGCPVLGALLVAQFWHLTTLSVIHLAWGGLLACGLTTLPSLRVLRIEFPQLTQAPRGFAQASAEGVAYLHCPALRALILEAECTITVSTKTLECFLRDLDAPTDRMTLALRRVEIWDVEPPEERTQFARIVVDAARGEHKDWLARADSLLGSAH